MTPENEFYEDPKHFVILTGGFRRDSRLTPSTFDLIAKVLDVDGTTPEHVTTGEGSGAEDAQVSQHMGVAVPRWSNARVHRHFEGRGLDERRFFEKSQTVPPPRRVIVNHQLQKTTVWYETIPTCAVLIVNR
ncbi:hypothetical protein RUM43_011811 [Polyplax serrata]|uniref:Uncharacterized protein n=1 Tax=Polyplax serrata TaxID=468196 RepID=A0AAN8RZG6_POLSC